MDKYHKNNNVLKGTIFAIIAGIMWGIGGISAQFLFNSKSLNPQWVVTVRLLVAGLILLTAGYVKTKNEIFKVWTHKKDRISLILYAILGMMAVQLTFFVGISYSNAATATVIQYLAPAIILIYMSFRNRKMPSVLEIFAVLLSIIGVFVLVTHGDMNNLAISTKAFIWCISSAVALAYYSIKPTSFKEKWSSYALTGWAMFIGGIVCNFINPIWNFSGTFDLQALAGFSVVIFFGTIIPFTIFSMAVKLIGPTRASLFSCIEPVATAIISVIVLGIPFELMDWIGTFLIISMVIILSLKKKK